MVESLARLTTLDDRVAVFPGHGNPTTIARERAWMELVRDRRRLFA
jgi:glyoxylase-like metal-dependent hydrolase (beta-lactamase superfamily II)